MPRELKVYGWREDSYELCPAPRNRAGSGQVRVIVAAHSVAEAARLAHAAGLNSGTQRNVDTIVRRIKAYGSVTGNKREVQLATSQPGVVFWQPANQRGQIFARIGEAWPTLIEVEVTEAIVREYEARGVFPDIPFSTAGVWALTIPQAKEMLEDAEFHADALGPNGRDTTGGDPPDEARNKSNTRRAYAALLKQIQAALKEAA